MFKRLEANSEQARKRQARERMSQLKGKVRADNNLQSLQEEVAELRKIVELLCQ